MTMAENADLFQGVDGDGPTESNRETKNLLELKNVS